MVSFQRNELLLSSSLPSRWCSFESEILPDECLERSGLGLCFFCSSRWVLHGFRLLRVFGGVLGFVRSNNIYIYYVFWFPRGLKLPLARRFCPGFCYVFSVLHFDGCCLCVWQMLRSYRKPQAQSTQVVPPQEKNMEEPCKTIEKSIWKNLETLNTLERAITSQKLNHISGCTSGHETLHRKSCKAHGSHRCIVDGFWSEELCLVLVGCGSKRKPHRGESRFWEHVSFYS